MKTYRNIAIIGDSIYRGTEINPEGIKRFNFTDDKYINELTQLYGTNFYNYSAFGLTTQKVLERKIHIEAVNHDPLPEIAIVSLGGNDCNFNWKNVADNCDNVNYPSVTEDVYFANIKTIISDIRARGVTPLIISLVPLHIERYFTAISRLGDSEKILRWLKSKQILYMWQENYNEILHKAAEDTNSMFINIRKFFLNNHEFDSLYGSDGIHLSQKGYKLLVDNLVREIKLLIE